MSDLTTLQTKNLSIFQIESELAELMEFRDSEDLGPEERVAVEQQIAAYVSRELTKVDNLRSFMRHCQVKADQAQAAAAIALQEVDIQRKRAQSWTNKLEHLKLCCLAALRIIDKRKLEGRTGSIRRQASGGKQALTVYDEKLLVDGFKKLTIQCNLGTWIRFMESANSDDYVRVKLSNLMASREWRTLIEPDKEAIRSELEKPCVHCRATPRGTCPDECPVCGGSGKQVVPGARLEPRSEHIVIG